ncbi:2'-5' RNA ligase family protein [Janthinobacterium psychrotolerans]|uniref:RNA 2',3'-cyclic phosphodiesterase n=1 Tax=Janthinobacterium psychrotolerans TaxID=1747903 RepID=A0A1A7C6M6_9BURK|nr:2'-5' RNA ligase family protein [Janthinobacterium psychrotolerans]OBV40415.1 2'-5' RNA ligase [Janthinobacterium psychrotolerans]
MKNLSPQPRLFYGLWPDAATRAAFAALQPAVGGTPSRPDKLHLTMAFLGQRAAHEMPALLAILDEVPASAITLCFDHFSYFPKAELSWAALRATPPALLALRTQLMRRLACAGLAPAFEHDRFTPHVTLARKAGPPPAAPFAPLIWQADQLVLVESVKSSGDYHVLASRQLV